MPPKRPPTVHLLSLGCPKNLVDSERILALLAEDGFVPTGVPKGADVILVNTCGFIEGSKAESIDTLVDLAKLKKRTRRPLVVATGCLVQRHGNELAGELPEVDAWIGPGEYPSLPEILRSLLRSVPGAAPIRIANRDEAPIGGARLVLTPAHYAYLRIAEGCDNPCTFCAIPGIRGRFRSRPIEDLAEEARVLSASGVRELVVIAQDSTDYGLDLYGKRSLPELFREISAAAEGVEWIRLMYAYPAHLGDDVLEAIRDTPRMARYIDVPFQHCATRVLRRMARRMTRESTDALVARIRGTIPGVAIRSTIIIGSPGETEDDHKEMLDFLGQTRLERLGAFEYSLEEGTPAARMKDLVDPETRLRRHREVMLAQQEVAFSLAQTEVGTTRRVLVDGPDPERPRTFLARGEHDAPEIDRVVRIGPSMSRLTSGTFHDVLIVGADGYDLVAEPLVAEPLVTEAAGSLTSR